LEVRGILTSKEVVEFTLLNICLGMSLRVDGESIDYKRLIYKTIVSSYMIRKVLMLRWFIIFY